MLILDNLLWDASDKKLGLFIFLKNLFFSVELSVLICQFFEYLYRLTEFNQLYLTNLLGNTKNTKTLHLKN
jgi:hypothetical protein